MKRINNRPNPLVNININCKSNQFSSESSTIIKDDLDYKNGSVPGSTDVIYHISRSENLTQQEERRVRSQASDAKVRAPAWETRFFFYVVTFTKQSKFPVPQFTHCKMERLTLSTLGSCHEKSINLYL